MWNACSECEILCYNNIILGRRFILDVSEFLPIYQIRSPNIMWLLGAGASAAAGIPTAYHMIWDFKKTLYCADKRIHVTRVEDMGDPIVRAGIQRHFDSRQGYPVLDSDDEYAYYFEALYPDEADRRRYIEQMVLAARYSYGHKALAALLKLDRARVVWTTNFDKLVEDAVAGLFGSTSNLVIASLSEPEIAMQALNEGRWPLMVKLHGDFQSRRLKNTTEELKKQDRAMRDALVAACKRYGLAVVGYSGRDHSIMDALEEAIDNGKGYPSGLFWFTPTNGTISDRVLSLIDKAKRQGIAAHAITSEAFDELLPDMLTLIPDVPKDVLCTFDAQSNRLSLPSLPQLSGGFPYIRLNALHVCSIPKVCRLIRCETGGTAAVKDAVAAADAQVIAARKNIGVIAFGSDSEISKVFSGDCELDLHQIEEHRILNDTAEHGLLHDALCAALARERPVIVHRGRNNVMTVDLHHANDPMYQDLAQAIRKSERSREATVCGNINGLAWAEAVRFRLEYRLGRIWLLLVSTIWVDWPDGVGASDDDVPPDNEIASSVNKAREFVRERLAKRYNWAWNDTLVAWTRIITGGQDSSKLRALGITDGVDAEFHIAKSSGFSRRAVNR